MLPAVTGPTAPTLAAATPKVEGFGADRVAVLGVQRPPFVVEAPDRVDDVSRGRFPVRFGVDGERLLHGAEDFVVEGRLIEAEARAQRFLQPVDEELHSRKKNKNIGVNEDVKGTGAGRRGYLPPNLT